MNRKTLSVSGMSCNGCEDNVENALKNLDGVTRVDADHTNDSVEIVANEDVEDDDIHVVIKQAGYDISA